MLYALQEFKLIGKNMRVYPGYYSFRTKNEKDDQNDFYIADVKNPTSTNLLRVNTKKWNAYWVDSVKNTRSAHFGFPFNYESVEQIATEGLTLSLIGKVSYDVTTDEFSMNDTFAVIGGGI